MKVQTNYFHLVGFIVGSTNKSRKKSCVYIPPYLGRADCKQSFVMIREIPSDLALASALSKEGESL